MNLQDKAWDILYGYGLAGLVIAALAFAVWILYNRVQELNDTLVSIGKESVASNSAVATSLDKLTDRITDLMWRSGRPEK